MTKTTFFVAGVPVPKGSAKAFYNKNAGKIVVMQTNREKQQPWASAIAVAAQQAGVKPTGGAVSLDVLFYLPRPKGHYGTGKNACVLKTGAPARHIVKPDTDKLLRLVMDALTGIAYNDDSQVDDARAGKSYSQACEYAGAKITVKQE